MAIFNGKIHYKWPFSIAMLVYQRVVITDNQWTSLCIDTDSLSWKYSWHRPEVGKWFYKPLLAPLKTRELIQASGTIITLHNGRWMNYELIIVMHYLKTTVI